MPTVLIVDDEPQVLVILKTILERAGFDVLAASSGEEALQYVSAQKPPICLIISDVRMPGLSGPEIIERIWATSPNIKAMLMSGYSPQGLPSGVPFLPKPFSMRLVLDTIHDLIGDECLKAGPRKRATTTS